MWGVVGKNDIWGGFVDLSTKFPYFSLFQAIKHTFINVSNTTVQQTKRYMTSDYDGTNNMPTDLRGKTGLPNEMPTGEQENANCPQGCCCGIH